MKWQWQPRQVRLHIPLPGGCVTAGRVQVCVFPTFWTRGRGCWPQRWRALPPVNGVTAPIYRWWQVGPIEVRLYRWKPSP